MLSEMISNSMTAKNAPTIADGVNQANEKLDGIKDTLNKIAPPAFATDTSEQGYDDAREIIEIFKTAITENNIILLINADPEGDDYYKLVHCKVVDSFVEMIKREIIIKCTNAQNEKVYSQVKTFAEHLESYCTFIRERSSVAEDGTHFVLNHKEFKALSLRDAALKKLTGREEVRGLLPQKPSIFDGKGILKVRKLDILYYEITGRHFLLGTKWGGWVDRDLADEAAEELINGLGCYVSQKDTVAEQLIDIFRFAIDKCQIIKYIKNDPTYRLEFPVVQLDYFKFTMDDLFDKYRHHQAEDVFGDIYRFSEKLQSYNYYLSCKMWHLRDNVDDIYVPHPPDGYRMNWQEEKEFEDRVLEYRKSID